MRSDKCARSYHSALRLVATLAWLNARVAVLYRLTHEEFAHVLSTFPLVPRAARDAALAAFDRLESLLNRMDQ